MHPKQKRLSAVKYDSLGRRFYAPGCERSASLSSHASLEWSHADTDALARLFSYSGQMLEMLQKVQEVGGSEEVLREINTLLNEIETKVMRHENGANQ